MMVMMMASTPSLKASRRPFVIVTDTAVAPERIIASFSFRRFFYHISGLTIPGVITLALMPRRCRCLPSGELTNFVASVP